VGLDLEAIWQEHRRFIVAVGAGAVVFSGLALARARVERVADGLAHKNGQEQERLLSEIGELEGKEGLEKGRKEGLARAQEAVLGQLGWDLDRGYGPRWCGPRWCGHRGTRRRRGRAAQPGGDQRGAGEQRQDGQHHSDDDVGTHAEILTEEHERRRAGPRSQPFRWAVAVRAARIAKDYAASSSSRRSRWLITSVTPLRMVTP